MELSFTQGRWNYEQWGGFDPLSSTNAKPVGVELWAVFDVPRSQVDTSWKNLTHALSGLFCASINFLESSTSYAAPTWGFRPNSEKLRYGSLPREAVCTENLTPWLKLLPCRDKDGISALMNRPSVYRGFYHSQRLHLSTVESGEEGLGSGIMLEQTLTVVLQPVAISVETDMQPSWSLSSLFGRKVVGRCVLAKSSNVYLQLEGLPTSLKNVNAQKEANELWKNSYFGLSIKPDRVLRETNSFLFVFDIEKSSGSEPFDLGLTWRLPLKWSCQQAPLHTSRFLMGSGNERGAIAILLRATESQEKLSGSDLNNGRCTIKANIFQIFPWYVKVYYHTLQIFVDKQQKTGTEVLKKINVSPSTDKMSSGMMEMMLELPCEVKSAAISIEYDKGFLHIDEYPPDANQGFDIPSALISFPDHHTSLDFREDELNKSTLLSIFEEKSLVRSYTEVLLVPLTTPDFSMPYNVITITCTVFALCFGSLLNALRRRIGEEERFLKSQAGKKKGLKQLLSRLIAKIRGIPIEEPSSSSSTDSPEARSSIFSSKLLFKIVLVAGAAAAWQYFSTDK